MTQYVKMVSYHLDPYKYVFGITPIFQIINSNLPQQKERMEIMAKSQSEMNSIIAERKIKSALTKEISPAVDI